MKGSTSKKSLCPVCPASLGISVTFHCWALLVPGHVSPWVCAFGQLRLSKWVWTWRECQWKYLLWGVIAAKSRDGWVVFPLVDQHVHMHHSKYSPQSLHFPTYVGHKPTSTVCTVNMTNWLSHYVPPLFSFSSSSYRWLVFHFWVWVGSGFPNN